jgi:hypothetical protein
MMLHKLRRSMVAPERSPLTGLIEVDGTYVGGHDAGRRSGRDAFGTAAIVVVAIEVRGIPCSASEPVCRRPVTRKSRTALSSQRS